MYPSLRTQDGTIKVPIQRLDQLKLSVSCIQDKKVGTRGDWLRARSAGVVVTTSRDVWPVKSDSYWVHGLPKKLGIGHG